MGSRLTIAVALYAGALAAGAQAADRASALEGQAPQAPAVDGVNLKLDAFGGLWSLDGEEAAVGMGFGSLSVPLAHSFGLQIDLGGGSFDGDGAFMATGHAFWRDPAFGLLGFHFSEFYWDSFDGFNARRGGIEAERYWRRWTLAAIAGIEGGDTLRAPTTRGARFDVDTGFFDEVRLSYYVTDNVRLTAGHAFEFGRNAATLAAEWGVPLGDGSMLTLYAKGRLGEADNRAVWGGLRLHFGRRDKPLIDRHREDDPELGDGGLMQLVAYGGQCVYLLNNCP